MTAGPDQPLRTLGMTEDQMAAYLDDLLKEEAEEAAAARGTSPAEELASPGFAAVRATASYTVSLIAANNAFLARQLLDLGLLGESPPAQNPSGEDGRG